MIYRSFQAYDILDRIRCVKTCWPDRPYGLENETRLGEYRRNREQIYIGKHVDLCKFYRAPILPFWNCPYQLIVDVIDGPIPDVFRHGKNLFVSEKVKNIIESSDPFNHQFSTVNVVDESHNSITETRYFTLNIRRQLEIESQGFPKKKPNIGGYPASRELEFVVTIQNNKQLASLLETLPIWVHIDIYSSFYMNGSFYEALKREGVTGIDELALGNTGSGTVKAIYDDRNV